MPASLAAASVSPASTVLPNDLATSFAESQLYPLLATSYRDGTVERSLVLDYSLSAPRAAREWQISRRLTTVITYQPPNPDQPAKLPPLRTFWESLQGKPFYFYPVRSQFDATGVSTTGRVTCFFRGPWVETQGMNRCDVQLPTIVEVL